jgi:very-short-patch-repair endonuclease
MSEADTKHTERTARVLVAVMNSERDFAMARDRGWYRIPYESAPSRVGADYLAFYQTRVFAEDRWAVNYYAPIKRYRVLPRRSIIASEPDHPRADALYYKIEIGPLRRLQHSIPSHRLRRITFIPTTLERLLRAREINDLWCGSRDEEQLWRAFKNNGVGAERRYPLREEEESYTIDFALFCKEGKVAVCLEGQSPMENVHVVREGGIIDYYDLAAKGWTVLRFRARELARPDSLCLSEILEAASRAGGVLPAPFE